jgi:hypothetical protein
MGHVVHRPELLRRTVTAVAGALRDAGAAADPEAAWAAAEAVLAGEPAVPVG